MEHLKSNQWHIYGPPTAQKFLNFMQFFGKFGKSYVGGPLPDGLALPPTGNPGSGPQMLFEIIPKGKGERIPKATVQKCL